MQAGHTTLSSHVGNACLPADSLPAWKLSLEGGCGSCRLVSPASAGHRAPRGHTPCATEARATLADPAHQPPSSSQAHPSALPAAPQPLTVVKDGVREDRRQAEGPACWVPHCHLEAEPHSIQVVVPALLFYGNCQNNRGSGELGSGGTAREGGARGWTGSSGLGGMFQGLRSSRRSRGGIEGSTSIADSTWDLERHVPCVPSLGHVSPVVKWECVLKGQQNSTCAVSLGQGGRVTSAG